MARPKVTTDHDTIREWAEKLQGRPRIIDDPTAKRDKVGIRIGFPGQPDDSSVNRRFVQPTSWDEFFRRFDAMNLALMYHDPPEPGMSPIDAYRFVDRTALLTELEHPEEFTAEP